METVASYLAKFPEASQKRMQQIRALILEKAFEAQESISYGMPACKMNGNRCFRKLRFEYPQKCLWHTKLHFLGRCCYKTFKK